MRSRIVRAGDRVTLNECEQREARFLARGRQRVNEEAGTDADGPVGDRPGLEMNLLGMGGEIAGAKFLNVYPDTEIGVRAGGPDLWLPSDHSVDVKSCPGHFERPMLVARITKRRSDADLYILLSGDEWTYTFRGWAPADRLLASIRDIGHGPSYVLKPEELEPVLNLNDPFRDIAVSVGAPVRQRDNWPFDEED
jgi:hypothetical protein